MTVSKTKALVVLSGGQDSTTCLVWAKQNHDEVHAVTFDYNQRHRREIQAAKNIALLCGVTSHEIVELGPILKGRSPLTNPAEQLETYPDYQTMDKTIGDRVELTFVPMRNALFLTLAANRASCLDANVIVTGVCQADNANYPDCRFDFIKSQTRTINEALGTADDRFATLGPVDDRYLSIQAPLMDMSKAQSIKFMKDLGWLPLLAFTHTAYDGRYPPVSKDHANTLRAQGFLEAGLPDPLVIRAYSEGLMDLPTTPNYENAFGNRTMLEAIERLKSPLPVGALA